MIVISTYIDGIENKSDYKEFSFREITKIEMQNQNWQSLEQALQKHKRTDTADKYLRK